MGPMSTGPFSAQDKGIGAAIWAISCVFVGACSAQPAAQGEDRASESSTGQSEMWAAEIAAQVHRAFPSHGAVARPAWVAQPDSMVPSYLLREPRSGLGIRVGFEGARPSGSAQLAEGRVYPQVLQGFGEDGGHVLVRPRADGIEDFVILAEHGGASSLVIRLELLDERASLRLVDDVLEVVDTQGTPRLRMLRPAWVDSAGERGDARVDVRDCDVDRDPRAPWGRATTPPGAKDCQVVVDWSSSAERMVLPAVLDPAWTTTGSMTSPRVHFTATVIEGGARVLMAGGTSQQPPVGQATAELYDVATQTFAQTGGMSAARAYHAAALLPNGEVLVSGGAPGYPGSDSDLAEAERYDFATGTWQAATAMVLARAQHRAVRLVSGDVLVYGYAHNPNGDPLSERYDPVADSWQVTSGQPGTWRRDPALVALGDGRALVLGGGEQVGLPMRTTEVYDAAADAWSQGVPMTSERNAFGAVELPDGRVLAVGGCDVACESELWNGTGWQATGEPVGWGSVATVLLDDGTVLFVGGDPTVTPMTSPVAVYDVGSESWTWISNLIEGRQWAELVALPLGRALVAGGNSDTSIADGVTSTAERFARAELGSICQGGAECLSGVCSVEGICCATSCDALCMACSEVLTGQADGTCAPVLEDTDPFTQCAGTVDAACSVPARCDGAGACQQELQGLCPGEGCGADGECRTGFCTDGYCCDRRCDGTCESCRGVNGVEDRGRCEPEAEGSDPGDECAADPADPCGAPGHCDGNGTCAEFVPAGWSCGDIACVEGDVHDPRCDGAGQCVVSTTECAPFGCEGHMCLSECRSNTECDERFVCKKRQCVPAPECIDETQLQWSDGEIDDCAPGRCMGGECVEQCRSSMECAPGARCDAEGRCRIPQEDDFVSLRCGCRTVGGQGGAPWMVGLGIGLWFWQVRRRRRAN